MVSTEFHKKFNSYVKTATEDNNFSHYQTVKQIYLSKVMGNLQNSFRMDQLEKPEEVDPQQDRQIKHRY